MSGLMKRSILALGFLTCLAGTAAAQELPLDAVLAEPVSTAAKYFQTSAEAPASVTIVSADDIRRFGYRTVADLLRGVAGFYTTYDRNYLALGVRGFSRPGDYSNRVLLLLDGHTVNEAVFGSAPVGTDLALDADFIERVEVVHGPSSALYGTGAMLASVNIVTRTGRSLDGVHVSATGASGGLAQVSAAAGGVSASGLDFAAAGQWTDSDGSDLFFPEYADVDGGVARGLDWERHRSLYTSMTWRGFSASALVSQRLKGIPTGAFDITFNDPRAQTRDDHAFVEARQEIRLAPAASLHVRGYWDRYRYDGTYPSGTLYTDQALDQGVGGEARLQWDLGAANRLVAGVEHQWRREADYASGSETATLVNQMTPFHITSVFVQDEWQLSRAVNVVVGLRSDARSEFEATLSPRAALVFHPSARTTAKLLAGEAFRAPSPYEVHYEDPPTGFKRSDGLKPERIRTFEGVLEQRLSGSTIASLSVYDYRLRNLVDTLEDPADGLLHFANVAKVHGSGFTTALRVLTRRDISAYLNYGYQRATNAVTSQELTNAPAHLFKMGIGSPTARRVQVGAEARVESSRLTVQDTRTEAHLWTGAHVRVRLGRAGTAASRWWDRGELSVALGNVFGAFYEDPGGFEHRQAAIEQDGRTVNARLRLDW